MASLALKCAALEKGRGCRAPETHVIGLAELRRIIWELQHESGQEAS
jgi:hypothetical protein